MKTTAVLWQRINTWCQRRSKRTLCWLGVLVAVAIGAVDYATGAEFSFSIFYLPPIILIAWSAGLRAGLAQAVLSSLIWLLADLGASSAFSHFGSVSWITLWNAWVRLCIFTLVVALLAEIRKLHDTLETDLKNRRAELAAEIQRRKDAESELTEAGERERLSIAQDLHDGLGTYLTGVAFQAQLLSASLAEEGSPYAQETQKLVGWVNKAISQTRALAKMIFPKDPVGDHTFCAGLAALAQEMASLFSVECHVRTPRCSDSNSAGCPRWCHAKPGAKPPEPLSVQNIQLYRLTQEAIRNAVVHGGSTRVEIEVKVQEPDWLLQIRDNGAGVQRQMTASKGLGQTSMALRAAAAGGCLETVSEPGGGHTVRCRIPVAAGGFPPALL